jgi:uncharacterized protein (DUF1501 family)
MLRLWEAGALGIVQGVGYPNPNRSHFESRAIWHTARPETAPRGSLGWIGRGLDADARQANGEAAALFIGDEGPPVALRGRRAVAGSFDRVEDLFLATPAGPTSIGTSSAHGDLDAFLRRSLLDSYTTSERLRSLASRTAPKGAADDYPATDLGRRLRTIAGLIRAGLGTRVYYTNHAGYDTHALQVVPHNALLGELADALWGFQRDLSRDGLDDRVAMFGFSEFGRRVAENGGRGTDHGTAGPVFLVGSRVKAGMLGVAPSLADLDDGDLRMTVDFRRVYAAILESWLGVTARDALGGEFGPLSLFRVSGSA